MVETGFKTKQVNTVTLSRTLRDARVAAGLSLEKLSEQTKIPIKYIRYLEDENYEGLPAEIYVKGFLRQCSSYLRIDPQPLIDLYTKEFNIRNNIKKSLFLFSSPGNNNSKRSSRNKQRNRLMQNFSRPRFVITPKLILAVATIALIAVIGYYFWYQVRSFVSGPVITIFEPLNDKVVNEGKIILSGKADPQSILKINGTAVSLSAEGAFYQTLYLNKGANYIKLIAINRQGKTSEVLRRIFVESN